MYSKQISFAWYLVRFLPVRPSLTKDIRIKAKFHFYSIWSNYTSLPIARYDNEGELLFFSEVYLKKREKESIDEIAKSWYFQCIFQINECSDGNFIGSY